MAQAVLAGRTKGYRQHPQLVRFRCTPDPLETIGAYLGVVAGEAHCRGYNFNTSRILRPHPIMTSGSTRQNAPDVTAITTPNATVSNDETDGALATIFAPDSAKDGMPRMPVTIGQLEYERDHLMAKLRERSPQDATRLASTSLQPHPLFRVVPGGIEAWERPHPKA